jgi:hypothetical protein
MATPSLLLIPDRYKAAKLYSQIPDSGAGDLTFARNSNATRVNSAGLIEKVRTNLILQSETFDNASWTKSNATITANSIANPVNGATTAETITFTGATDAKYLLQSNTISGSYSQSVYFKYSTHQWMQLFQSGDGAFSANFDIQNGVLGSSTGCTPSIVSVGSGWYRCTITFASTTATQFVIWAIDSGTDTRATNSASTGSVYIFGAQLEVSDFGATPYIPTTTAAVSVGITADIPRLDYTGGGCPSLLLEPQRTNIATYSEQFDTIAGWSLFNGTQVPNTTETLDPSGYYGAEKVIMGVTTSATYRKSIGGLNNGDTYTLSLYIKQGSGVTAFLDICDTSTTVDITPTSEWVRYTKTGVWDTSLAFIDLEFRGVDGAYCYIWGAQLELGSYPTSYIPTLGSSVTRLADAASKTGISSLIGQAAGTVFADLTITKPTSGNADFLLIENAATPLNGVYVLFMDANGQIGFFSYPSAAFGLINAVNYSNQRIKVAYAYSSAGLVIYINGSQVFLDGSVSLGSGLSTFGLNNPGTATISANVSQTLLYPVRLSSAELATLTAL